MKKTALLFVVVFLMGAFVATAQNNQPTTAKKTVSEQKKADVQKTNKTTQAAVNPVGDQKKLDNSKKNPTAQTSSTKPKQNHARTNKESRPVQVKQEAKNIKPVEATQTVKKSQSNKPN